jgi:fructosamine-3-kinase
LLAELHDIRRHFPALLDIGPVGTLTHYDIWTGNVMVDLSGDHPRITGYLDMLGYYADYARELSSMFRLTDQHLMQAYGQRHGFDRSFEVRFSLYTLKMCLQLVNMYPTEPRHIEDARRHLQVVQRYCASQKGIEESCHPIRIS